MKLYYSPGACSMAPHIILNELGLTHATEKVDLGAKKTESGGNYLEVNGKGYVPTLDLGKGQILTEVAVILQYLADHHEDAKLFPKFGTMERYQAMETLNFIASELHKGIGGLFNQAMPEDGKTAIKNRLQARLDWLDEQLSKQDYVAGKSFTSADAYAFTVLGWSKWVGLDLSKWENIGKYLGRVAARPAVQKTLKDEGLAG
jgi:glutathione S-transferase